MPLVAQGGNVTVTLTGKVTYVSPSGGFDALTPDGQKFSVFAYKGNNAFVNVDVKPTYKAGDVIGGKAVDEWRDTAPVGTVLMWRGVVPVVRTEKGWYDLNGNFFVTSANTIKNWTVKFIPEVSK